MVATPGNGDRMYRRLEVPPAASVQQIRRAYRRLARDLHPDTNPEDPEASRRFQEITEAYELLSSPESRARYDGARQRPEQPDTREAGPSAAHAQPQPAGWAAPNRPTVIGAAPIPLGSPPLVAGPVRVVSPDNRTDERLPVATGELGRLIQAVWELWGRW